jgi:hypothetical protein
LEWIGLFRRPGLQAPGNVLVDVPPFGHTFNIQPPGKILRGPFGVEKPDDETKRDELPPGGVLLSAARALLAVRGPSGRVPWPWQ